jgi:hypothetical protein
MALGHELATWWWALRGTVPTLAEEALGRIGFRAAARGNGFVRLQGSLRPDPAAAEVPPRRRSLVGRVSRPGGPL